MATSLSVTDYEPFLRMSRQSRAPLLGGGGQWLKDADCVVNAGPAPHWGAGEYAIVGKFHSDDGTKFAFRAPLRPFSQDVVQRERVIGAHLASLPSRPACLVHNGFYEGVAQVAGQWVDAYRMEWVEGELLGDSLAALCHSGNSRAINDLADRWQALMLEMEAGLVAHGDLQHDNVMVRPDGSLVLLDYDTMFVPALAGAPAPALGLKGYTHPAVLDGTVHRPYNLTIDTFPGLVVLLSLRALGINPQLKMSDPCFRTQNLLFRDKQLLSSHSEALRLIGRLNDPDVVWLAVQLGEMCDDARRSFVAASEILSKRPGGYLPKGRRKNPISAVPSPYTPRPKRGAASQPPNEPYAPKGKKPSPPAVPPPYKPKSRETR